MKTANILTIVVLGLGILVCAAAPGRAEPVGTAFTYQGRLIDTNSAAEGLYDLQFGLYDSNSGGSQVGDYVNVNDVDVIDGYFAVELDFNDANAFNGEARWLEIGVVPSDSNARSTILSPRQEVTPAPYAIYAANASNDNDWMTSGDDMYSAVSGNVGIGTVPTDAGKLQVITPSGTGVHGETTANVGSGISGIASNTGNVMNYGGFFKSEGSQGIGVVGGATGTSGKGVYGVASNPNDVANYGGYFYAAGGFGRGVYSKAAASSGTNYGVYGKTNSSDGYAGYFEGGRNYFEGNVGIGTVSPTHKLDVTGTVNFNSGLSGGQALLVNGSEAIWYNGTYFSWGYGGTANYFADNVGIGVTNPSYKLSVGSGLGGWEVYINDDLYVVDIVSALTLVDRTSYPPDLATAYKAVMSMERLPDGQYEQDNKEAQLDHSKLSDFIRSKDGNRDLSATVSCQNEVIKDLIRQNKELKERLDTLEQMLAVR